MALKILRYLLALIFAMNLLSNYVYNNDVYDKKIKGLDNEKYSIRVDFSNFYQFELKVFLLKKSIIIDSLIIESVTSIKNIEIYNNRFIFVKYGLRSGTGCKLVGLLGICCDNNKICICMSIISEHQYHFDKTWDKEVDKLKLFDEHEKYKMKIESMDKSNGLNLHETHHISSKYEPNTNLDEENYYFLYFDEKDKIFYNEDSVRIGNKYYKGIVLERKEYIFKDSGWSSLYKHVINKSK